MKNLAFSMLFLLAGVSVVPSQSLSEIGNGKDLLQIVDINYRTAIRAMERGYEVVRQYVKEMDERDCYKELSELFENSYAKTFNVKNRVFPPHMEHMWWINQQKKQKKQ